MNDELSQINDDIHMIIGAINVAKSTQDPDRYLDAQQLIARCVKEWETRGMLLLFIGQLGAFAADIYKSYAATKDLTFDQLMLYDYQRVYG